MQFDTASIAAKLQALTARSLAGASLALSQEPTDLAFIANRVPGAEQARPRGPAPYVMVSVSAVYRSPDRSVPIPTGNPQLPGHVQAYDRAGGLQKAYGPRRLPGTSYILDPLVLSIVVDNEPSAILIGQGLLLDFLEAQFNLQDARSNEGNAPVRFP